MSDVSKYRNKVAVVGAATVPTVRHSKVPVGSLAVEASHLAIADAGLTRDQVDGVACGISLPAYGGVPRAVRSGFDFVDSDFLARHLELQTTWTTNDSALPSAFLGAAQAVISGMASYVLVNRTLHNPPGRYHSFSDAGAAGEAQWTIPYGYIAPVTGMAMPYMQYQQRYGARREHMATLVVQLRKNVQRIPHAYWYGTELTVDDYMQSRMISEPMCLFDNDIPVDGSGSFILTTAERARDLPHKPVFITDWAHGKLGWTAPPGSFPPLDDYYDGGLELAMRLWGRSGWQPKDVDVVELYDGFTPLVFFWLETLGFCPIGTAWQFIQEADIAAEGRFPLLSGGGSQGWGRLHGLSQMLECYWQLSDRAGDRQLARAERAISTFAFPSAGQAVLYSTDAST